MSSALLRMIDHEALMRAIGTDTVSSIAEPGKCPLCKSLTTMTVSHGYSGDRIYRCTEPRCRFTGDAIMLWQTVSGDKTVEDACINLTGLGCMAYVPNLHEIINGYKAKIDLEKQCGMDFWDRCQQFLRDGTNNGSVRGIFTRRISCDCNIDACRDLIGACDSELFTEFFSVPPNRKKFIGTSKCFAVIPLWLDHLTISGFLLIDRNGEQLLVRRDGASHRNHVGYGFAGTCTNREKQIIVTQDYRHVMGLVTRAYLSSMRIPIVLIQPSTVMGAVPPADRYLAINPDNDGGFYRRLLKLGAPVNVLTERELNTMADHYHHINVQLNDMQGKAISIYEAVALRLGSLSATEYSQAAALTHQLDLTFEQRTRVIASAGEHIRPEVEAVLERQSSEQSIEFSGDIIECVTSGWFGRKAGLISDTMFFVEQTVYDNHQKNITCKGHIVQGSKQFEFESPIEEVQNKTHDWLAREVLKNMGNYPSILRSWRNKLWDMSIRFRTPTTTHTTSALGWLGENTRLVLPSIVVENGVVRANENRISVSNPVGAHLVVPRELAPSEMDDLVYNDEAGGLFWALFAAVAANLMYPFHPGGKMGIGLIDVPDGALTKLANQMANAIGLHRATFGSATQNKIKQVKDLERESPLPVFIPDSWARTDGFRNWLQADEVRNCVVQMDRTAAVATNLEGGWTYIYSDLKSDSWLRFENLWRLLPRFVAWTQSGFPQWPKTRSETPACFLAAIESWLESMGLKPHNVIQKARTRIAIDITGRGSTWGVRFINFIIEAYAADIISVNTNPKEISPDHITFDNTERVVFVPQKLIATVLTDMGIAVPSNAHIREAMMDIKALAPKKYGTSIQGVAIDQGEYSMYWAMRQDLSVKG